MSETTPDQKFLPVFLLDPRLGVRVRNANGATLEFWRYNYGRKLWVNSQPASTEPRPSGPVPEALTLGDLSDRLHGLAYAEPETTVLNVACCCQQCATSEARAFWRQCQAEGVMISHGYWLECQDAVRKMYQQEVDALNGKAGV
jgi:hypothetical protein